MTEARTGSIWCDGSDDPAWTGEDFGVCFRHKVLDGIIPFSSAALSLLAILTPLWFRALLWAYRRSFGKSGYEAVFEEEEDGEETFRNDSVLPVDVAPALRRRTLSRASGRTSFSRTGAKGSREHNPIWKAEMEVIEEEAIKDYSELALRRKMGDKASGNGANGHAKETEKVTWRKRLGAVTSVKKDLADVLLSVAITGLLWTRAGLQLEKGGRDAGPGWLLLTASTWTYFTILSTFKLALAYRDKLSRLVSPTPVHRIDPLYSKIEWHTIPFFLNYTLISALDFRSGFLGVPPTEHPERAHLRKIAYIELAIFSLVSLTTAIELVVPRPSRFISRSSNRPEAQKDGNARAPAPDLNASLISSALFIFMESFIFKHVKTPPEEHQIPDLRPDDKSAATLLKFRKDAEWIDSLPRLSFGSLFRKRTAADKKVRRTRGLTIKLLYHFRNELLYMQFWSVIGAVTTVLPTLFLKLLLDFISTRFNAARMGLDLEKVAPLHVAALYIAGQFLCTMVMSVAHSQGLIMGRRVCIRARAVIVSEIFTKALRRKEVQSRGSKGGEKVADEADKGAREEEKDEVKASSGKVLNLISVDAFKVSETAAYIHFLFPMAPVELVLGLTALFYVLGWSALAGLAAMFVIAILQYTASTYFIKYQKRVLATGDKRINLASEVIQSIKIVKFFGWEESFKKKIEDAREAELHALILRSIAFTVSNALLFGSPIAISLVTFWCYTKLLGNSLTAGTAFTSLALFSVIRGPLEILSNYLTELLSALVSLKRINDFLFEEESQKYNNVARSTSRDDPLVGFRDATFRWAPKDEDAEVSNETVFELKGLNISFPVGKLSIIIGPVGSGKSTLLMSLLGETNKISGHVFLPSPIVRDTAVDPGLQLTESTAYCPQVPWLLSASIRENILFGSPMNESRYKNVLEACALEADLKALDLGDETEVGEKGTVVSGGQKARISLARALYSPAKYLLIDDMLAAVDSHTAQHLYNTYLKGPLMKGRTCILVTHNVDLCLPGSAFLVQMDSGRIIQAGPTSATKPQSQPIDTTEATKGPDALVEELAGAPQAPVVPTEAIRAPLLRKPAGEETKQTGAVKPQVYGLYLTAFGGNLAWVVAMALLILGQGTEIGSSYWLRNWAASNEEANRSTFISSHLSRIASLFLSPLHENARFSAGAGTPAVKSAEHASVDYYLGVYLLLGIITMLALAARVSYFAWRGTAKPLWDSSSIKLIHSSLGVVASRLLFRKLINAILGARVRFFDSTPVGQIMNRLSKDQSTVDQDLIPILMFLGYELVATTGVIVAIVLAVPVFIFVSFGIALLYVLIIWLYVGSSRELKRTESVTRSPIYALFGEVMTGSSSVRAYGDTLRFARQMFNLVNRTNTPFFTLWLCNRWLSIRTDAAGACVVLITSIFVILFPSIDAALAGFALSYAIQLSERLLWTTRLYAQQEISMNSVERIKEYLEIDQEPTDEPMPPAYWPSRDGDIVVEGLTVRYSEELSDVLSDVSFTVRPKEKVGIVGRTGSGKSTLALSFFRFVEARKGSIIIDGQDISKVCLTELRRRLSIIPQDAHLFAGTIRFNLDPFEKHDDAAIWDVLRRVKMAASDPSRPVSRVPSSERLASAASDETATEDDFKVITSLDMEVVDGGKNFSSGQRQLLALGRGLLKLRSSSILFLDESTASLDSATDEYIQGIIREQMADATILCIAHRLRTIIDYDRVLVLGAGKVIEYESPLELLKRPESAFAELCRRSGEFELLLDMAEKAAEMRAAGKAK